MSYVIQDDWTGLGGVIGTLNPAYADDLKELRTKGLSGLWRADDATSAGGVVTLPNRVARGANMVANSAAFSPTIANEAAANNQPFAAFDGTDQLQAVPGPSLSTSAFTWYFAIIPTDLSVALNLLNQAGGLTLVLQANGSLRAKVGAAGTNRDSSVGKMAVGVPVLARVSWNSADGLIKFAFNGVADGAGQAAGAAPGAVTITQFGGANGANMMKAKLGMAALFNGIDHGALPAGSPYAEDPGNFVKLVNLLKYGQSA